MTPSLRMNLVDAALGEASGRLAAVLSVLGQGDPRAPLLALLDAKPAVAFCQERSTACEDAVQVLNFLMFAADAQQRLSDDKLADLCAFFIQRIRFS